MLIWRNAILWRHLLDFCLSTPLSRFILWYSGLRTPSRFYMNTKLPATFLFITRSLMKCSHLLCLAKVSLKTKFKVHVSFLIYQIYFCDKCSLYVKCCVLDCHKKRDIRTICVPDSNKYRFAIPPATVHSSM